VAILRKIESQLSFTTTDAKQSGVMAAVGGSPADQAVVLVSRSESGTLFCLMNIATGSANSISVPGTYYGKVADVATPPPSVSMTQCASDSYKDTEAAGW
jgi:hypothetical protein